MSSLKGLHFVNTILDSRFSNSGFTSILHSAALLMASPYTDWNSFKLNFLKFINDELETQPLVGQLYGLGLDTLGYRYDAGQA